MKFTCNIDKKKHLQFYMTHENSNIELSKSRCLSYGKKKIKHYLNKIHLFIRPLSTNDITYLSNPDIQKQLCEGDMDINITSILSDIEEYNNNQNVSEFTQNDGSIRITYVLCHRSKPSIILGLVSAVVNYKDKNLEQTIEGLYKQLKQMNTLYIELGCSSSKYKKFVSGTNYFIRAYILLVALENMPVTTLWGQVSGTVRGSKDELFKLHKKRSCLQYQKSDFYICDVFTFLNEFFRRLNTDDLLLYTKTIDLQ